MEKKTKIVLVVFIVAILVVSSVLFFVVFQTKYEKSDFIGTWYGQSQISDLNPTATLIITFYENGSLKVEHNSPIFKDNSPILECKADATNNTLTVTNLSQYNHYIWWCNWELKNNELLLIGQNGNYSPECSFKFENKNKMDLILDRISFQMTKTDETNFVLPQTNVKWEDIYIRTWNLNISGQINVNLTRSAIGLNLTNISYYDSYEWRSNYAPAEWGNVTIGDVLQFPKYEAEYFVDMMYRISIEPPKSGGIGTLWTLG